MLIGSSTGQRSWPDKSFCRTWQAQLRGGNTAASWLPEFTGGGGLADFSRI